MNQKKAKKLRRDARLISNNSKGLPTEDITKQYYLKGEIQPKVVVGRRVVIPKSGTVAYPKDSQRAVYQQIKKLEVANAK